MSDPIAYFLTWHTYGTWLPGDPRGSVDEEHNEYEMSFLAGNLITQLESFDRLGKSAVKLTQAQRELVQETNLQVCEYRAWHLVAVHVRTTHVHAVVSASATTEKVLNDFKAYTTRRLREQTLIGLSVHPWSRGGSKKYVWNERQLHDVAEYVVNRQGVPLIPKPYVNLTYLR